jgi:hypothetical protein
MATYVSFFEFSMKNGELFAHLGSGLARDIIDRQLTDPSIRLCMQEPCNEQVNFRAKCGIAEMTPTGPKPLPHNNEAEARGAWIRLLTTGPRVIGILNDACQERPHNTGIEAALRTGWIEIEGGSIKESDLASVCNILAYAKLENPESKVLVRFGGTPDQVRQILSLLKETSI